MAKEQIQTTPERTKTAVLDGTTLKRRVSILAAVIVGIYLLDLLVPKEVPLLTFYWLPVLLAATFANPRQVALLNAEAAVLAVISGLQLGIFSHPDYVTRLVALAGISWFTLRLTRERQAKERQLAQANSHLEATLHALPDLLFEVDRQGLLLQVQALQPDLLLGEPNLLIGRPLESILPPEAVAESMQALAEAELRGSSLGHQILLPLPQGDRWYELSVARKRPVTGAVHTYVVLSRDVHDRKQAEAALKRQIRFYAILSRCNRAIATSNSREQLFEAICHEAIATGDLGMAWVGVVNAATAMVDPVAMAGEGSGYLKDIHISTLISSPYGRGPVGRAVREGEPIWCQDFLHDPTTQAWHARASQYHWASVASLPLRCEGEVMGTLTLYAGLPQAFSQEIQTLLEDMVVDVDLALDRLARTAKGQVMQNALQRSEREYRELTETIHDVIWRIDAESLTYLYVSPAVHRLLGYAAEELIGKPLINAQSDENRRWISNLRELYAQSQRQPALNLAAPYRLDELQHLHRDGSVVWSEVTTTLVRNSNSGAMEFHCVSRDITARKQAESQLEWLAFYDQLTELPNRTLVHNLLEQMICSAHREDKPVALLMLGLDHFKTINDSIGYDTGDAVLMEVARRLKQELRATDLIGRIGSDEFLVVLPGAAGPEAGQLGELLQKAIRRPFIIHEQTINLTSSIGIALYPLDGTDQTALVRKADTAMTQAKRDGRNRFHFFTSSLEKEVVRMVELANALHGALDRQELRLLYQPQVDARSGQVLGAEALLRWQHDRFGPVDPAEFIPIAEGNGQILAIGEWVLQEAIQQLRQWQDGGLELRQIAVNLSAVQFRQQNLADRVIGLLQEAGLATHQLDLELTESVTMENPEAAIEAMARFSDAGIQLSIDDFGTGYSSLSYLKRLRVNKLKIDASFVRDLASRNDDRSIVSAIINLARGLNIRTTAEGVESEDQLAVLRELGCDEIQGFLYARPLTATEFEGFARRHGTARLA